VVNKNTLDVAQIFQTYITFCGDVDRTAVALNLDAVTIEQLAQAENWKRKAEQWNGLREGDPRDVQIQINRAVNYVQAHRLRALLDLVIADLQDESKGKLIDRLTVNTKNGPEFKTRALTDLVKAAEACQLMTQRALGDTSEERPEEQGSKGSNIALLVMKALSAADETGLDSVAIVRKQIAAESGK
jgi:hypothetical protein